ncbi:MAG: T9SS type A sorting domain-containing protein [Ignavibacteria bacterium]
MGHKIILLLILSIFFFNECRSQYSLEWIENTTRPDSSRLYPIDLILDKSLNFYIVGDRYSVAKINPSGNQLWNVSYNLPGFFMSGRSNAVTNDDSGNVYLTGEADSIYSNKDFLTMKYNQNGIFQWSRYYDSPLPRSDRAYDIKIYNNKYLYVVGSNAYGDSGNCNFKWTLLKYDLNGNEIWRNQYCGYTGYIAGDYPPTPELAIDSNGSIIISGDNLDSISYQTDLIVIKYDSSGNRIWQKEFSNTYQSSGLEVDLNHNIYIGSNSGLMKLNSDGDSLWHRFYINLIDISFDSVQNIVLTRSVYQNPGYIYIINKIDPSSNDIWTVQSEYGYFPVSVYQNQNDKIFLEAYGIGNQRYKYHTFVYNSDGTLFWNDVYELKGDTCCNPLKIISDKNDNIYVSGIEYNTTYPTRKVLSLKYSILTGNTFSETIIPDKFLLHQNFPNPFNPKTVINYELPVTGNAELKVFDVLGNEVAVLVNEKQSAGNYKVEFDGSNFASGVYFYRLDVDGNIIGTKRMVLLK